MSLELQSVSLGEYYVDVKYRVEHWGENTVVHSDDILVQFPKDQHFKPTFLASIKIDDCEAETYEEALDKLARWMSRMAKGIMERGKPLKDFSIMYDNVKPEKLTHVSLGIDVPHDPNNYRNDEKGYTVHNGIKLYDDDDIE